MAQTEPNALGTGELAASGSSMGKYPGELSTVTGELAASGSRRGKYPGRESLVGSNELGLIGDGSRTVLLVSRSESNTLGTGELAASGSSMGKYPGELSTVTGELAASGSRMSKYPGRESLVGSSEVGLVDDSGWSSSESNALGAGELAASGSSMGKYPGELSTVTGELAASGSRMGKYPGRESLVGSSELESVDDPGWSGRINSEYMDTRI